MRTGVITYNLYYAKKFVADDMFLAFVLLYLLKALHSNSIIYSTDPLALFSRLKREKRLPVNFKYTEFEKLFDYLYKNGYIYTEENNHLALKKIGTERGYYKSKFSYIKNNIRWKGMKALLVKEFILHSIYQQDKAITYRNDLTTRKNKARKPSSVRKIGEKLEGVGESYSTYKVFSYRGISSKLGLSISEVHRLVELLIKGGKLIVRTIKTRLEKSFCKLDVISDLTGSGYGSGYFYMHKGYLVKVLGTEVVSSCIK